LVKKLTSAKIYRGVLRLSNSMVKLNIFTWSAVRRNMIAVAFTPVFVATFTDLLGWQHRIVITPTV